MDKTRQSRTCWPQMILTAVTALNKKQGASIIAIKRWIVANNEIKTVHITPFLRRGLKATVAAGKLIRVRGKGLTGSFKLPAKRNRNAPRSVANRKPAVIERGKKAIVGPKQAFAVKLKQMQAKKPAKGVNKGESVVMAKSVSNSQKSTVQGFLRGLEPEKILGGSDSSGRLLYRIKWKGSNEIDWVTASEANKKCPHVVISFYEKKLNK